MADDTMVFPGAAYICMAIEAARRLFDTEHSDDFEVELKAISFVRALIISQAPNNARPQTMRSLISALSNL